MNDGEAMSESALVGSTPGGPAGSFTPRTDGRRSLGGARVGYFYLPRGSFCWWGCKSVVHSLEERGPDGRRARVDKLVTRACT